MATIFLYHISYASGSQALISNLDFINDKHQFFVANLHPLDRDTSLTAKCGIPVNGRDQSRVVCEISTQKVPLESLGTSTTMCKVALPENEAERIASKSPNIFPMMRSVALQYLNERNVIMNWKEIVRSEVYVKVVIVDLLKCKLKELTFKADPDNYIYSNVLTYKDNTFDVLAASSNSSCGAKKCRINFDERGEEIYPRFPINTNARIVQTTYVIDSDNEKNFFLLSLNPDFTHKLMHFGQSGTQTFFTTLPPTSIYPIPTSNANKKYASCTTSLEPRCFQFTAAGDLIMNHTIKTENKFSKLIGVHNVAEGGILVLTTTCPSFHLSVYKCQDFWVKKVNQDGKYGQSMKIVEKDFACDFYRGTMGVSVIENENEICFNLVCVFEQKSHLADEITRTGYTFLSNCTSQTSIRKL
ncbi:hypothetical protein QAD02_005491 [Eretmocerus hayati]|uniref:Uncharacterized protein n=1 Tax=Eretmocerus hayati TaxID=131215 RepID=A0ACC2NSL2_9HYME|nr:hypothetical protein QAD02_005491 [Eretmocerus hayati]